MSLQEPSWGKTGKPLVSVCLYNYNYGCYLRQCLDSVFSQTYDNIEICFSDNASTDESWNIALEYAEKHPGIMTLTRNRRNFGGYANLANCLLNVRGKYFIELCSDDAIEPEYVEQCVSALESNPNAGFVMVHRAIIDENDKRTEEPPFYNKSCVIPGAEQAAVYMMAAVNPSVSQIMYNTAFASGKRPAGGIATRWYGARILDFSICSEYNIVYLKEPLLLHRLHSQNDSFRAADNLMEVIGPYVLQHQFADMASCHDHMKKASERLPQSLEKLARLCIRYCVRALSENEERCALRYFHLGAAIMPELENDETFKRLQEYWNGDSSVKSEIINSLKSTDNLVTRSISYDPPSGSVEI
jgi:glycosyltransferase involved in cell wall biosynthesis